MRIIKMVFLPTSVFTFFVRFDFLGDLVVSPDSSDAFIFIDEETSEVVFQRVCNYMISLYGSPIYSEDYSVTLETLGGF